MPKFGTEESQVLLSILEDLPVGVWVARAPAGELVYANRSFSEILGMPARDDVRFGDYAPAYRLRDREGRPYPEGRLPFAQALERRETVVVDDIVIEPPDGKGVNVRAFGKPIFDAAGELTHVIVAFIDVTVEANAENVSHAARERLRTALQHAPVILFAYDNDGMITLSEGAGLAGLGFKPGELVGRSLHEIYGDNPTIMTNHKRVLTGETFTTVAEMGRVVLETWLAPLRDAQGAIVGVIGVSTDITERLRLQGQVAETERLAAMGRLAASVGHEINNPLTFAIEAVRLAREACASGGGDAASTQARVEELLADAGAGLERVRLITRDLRAFARADDEARGPQDLGRALATAAKMVATRTGPRSQMEVLAGPSATVLADETRLVQIFVNLILNAVDALPADRAETNRISLRSRLERGWAIVEVADNGPGVEAGLRDRVFDPFFTTKPVGEGTGLGLFVTRNLVEALGGTIVLGEAEGGGALFTIRLPAIEAPASAASRAVAAETAAPRATRARVLIVDDEPQLASLFRKTLEADYEVLAFTSGRAALAHLLENPAYDLVLCDLMMADVSGMKLHEELGRQRPGLERSIVFMTGGVFDPKVADFLASVPNDCVDKPFDLRAEARRRLPPA